ncbi:MAG: hypothetical protein G01um101429_602 [Parcubacteria group bacterium Gr01-1014_29]|nr:MAG: hypothetical protein G01um101429_602 [Parcubacteria group bacterium Gr01-1014_29]
MGLQISVLGLHTARAGEAAKKSKAIDTLCKNVECFMCQKLRSDNDYLPTGRQVIFEYVRYAQYLRYVLYVQYLRHPERSEEYSLY